ncbi:MAG: methylenetetrahydrofolate reductase [Gammaproteobacteria bacterium]|nr:methylenetetrahydrofolate reductase [Gammaproteobacteria bacterium]
MIAFSTALKSKEFVVTSELNPPKGTDLTKLYEAADRLRDCVDAFNLTDSHNARMSVAPMAVAHMLHDRGIESIVQVTTRDRNRIALQADLLGAAVLGVNNIVAMGGDPPGHGDHPEAKPVFDVYAAMIIKAARALENGTDLAGNTVNGTPKFCVGAVVNPGATNITGEIKRMEEKIQAGADFLQTQAIFDPGAFEKFVKLTESLNVPVLAGIIPLKSAKMAAYLNAKVPGIHVPDVLIREIDEAVELDNTSTAIAVRTIKALRGLCQGVHIMPVGRERLLPRILEEAGISSGTS